MSKNLNKKGDVLKIDTDSVERGNPGPAGCAFLLVHNDNIIYEE